MNRRDLMKAGTGAAVIAATGHRDVAAQSTPEAASDAVDKYEWQEYVMVVSFDKVHLTDAWIELVHFNTEEGAKKAYQKLVTIEANDVELREFAGTEFLMETEEGLDEAVELIEVTLEHDRLPSILSFLDVTGNDWVVSAEGGTRE